MGDIERPKITFATAQCKDIVDRAMAELRAWHIHPDEARDCPYCGKAGVKIVDRSARPHAEWYAFSCDACGLDDALSIPLSSHRPMI